MPHFNLHFRNNALYGKINSRLHQKPKLAQRLKNLLLLLCSLLVGAIPPLLWLLLLTVWYYLPVNLSSDVGILTLLALLLSPFVAGFAHSRWQGNSDLSTGTLPAFLLWITAFICYFCLFRTLNPQKTLVTLAISLLLGIAGAMSAAKISKIKPHKQKE